MKLSRKHRNTLCHAVMNVVMALAPAGLILFPLSQKALGTPPSETVVRVQPKLAPLTRGLLTSEIC